MTLLHIRGLDVVYRGGVHAVRGVDLHLAHGEAVALVGESGCGKTSVVHAVTGLLPPRTRVGGQVALTVSDGTAVDLVTLPEASFRRLRGREIGYVGQNPYRSCDPLRNVGHHVASAWRAHGETPPAGAVIDRLSALGIVDAAPRSRLRPHQWSGGMLQRAAMAAGSALAPRLLVADEPTSALDADLAWGTLAELRGLASALLLVTHDLSLARDVADTVYVLYGGEVVETGPAAAVLGAPSHPYTQALRAAVPTARGQLPTPLPGRPPDPRRERSGCAFADRCALVVERCRHERPVLVRGVACPEVVA